MCLYCFRRARNEDIMPHICLEKIVVNQKNYPYVHYDITLAVLPILPVSKLTDFNKPEEEAEQASSLAHVCTKFFPKGSFLVVSEPSFLIQYKHNNMQRGVSQSLNCEKGTGCSVNRTPPPTPVSAHSAFLLLSLLLCGYID